MRHIIRTNLVPLILVALGVSVASINLYNFPYFEGDEGIYTSRAWTFLKNGTLSTDTYWYDHPPAGWLLLSMWLFISRSETAFSSLLTSGRTFIFAIFGLNTLMTYLIGLKLTNSRLFALISPLLVVFSSIQLYFGRRILLDNLMLFWVLLTFTSLLYIQRPALRTGLSAMFFAVAVLTKENAILFAIPFIWLQLTTGQQKKTTLRWLGIALLIVSLYPLYAISRGEFLPNNYFENGGKPSLLSTLMYQASRGKTSIFDTQNSSFLKNFSRWAIEDPILIIGGLTATILNLILVKPKKLGSVLALFVIVQFAFLMRGGIVFEFYILPLLPFLAINIAFFLHTASSRLRLPAFTIAVILVAVTIVTSLTVKGFNPFTEKQASAQLAAIEWIMQNTDSGGIVITDSYAKADLYKRDNLEIRSHFDAQYDWDFKQDVLTNKKEITYLLITEQVEKDVKNANLDFVKNILSSAHLVKEFSDKDWQVKIYKPDK